jgi:hypothetical protein
LNKIPIFLLNMISHMDYFGWKNQNEDDERRKDYN